MRRILIIFYSAFVLLLLANYVFYKGLYNNQINYIFELLDQQVRIAGLEVDETNNTFVSDLNQINFEVDLSLFFRDEGKQRSAIEKMKQFFLRYGNLVTGIKYNDNQKNEFTLKQDTEREDAVEWLEQPFVLHRQAEIYGMEKLMPENRRYNYYLPVFDRTSKELVGNLVVTVDFEKYFDKIFTTFNLQDYEWQWVVSDSGEIIYDNYDEENAASLLYSQLERITSRLAEGSVENIVHNAVINGQRTRIISSYYSAQLLQREMGLVFSSPTAFFQKYLIKNALFIVLITLFLFILLIYIFTRYLKGEKARTDRIEASEKMLSRLIDEMPAGVIVHNRDREIIKANKIAAEQYSFKDVNEMQGKIFPERSLPGPTAANEGMVLHPDRFVVLKKEKGEMILFRESIPVQFMGEDATMEVLVDVTLLESARKNEAKANVAKSDFLARMSYEIRTPLSGIIGMTDVLGRSDLTPEVRDVVNLLSGSTEVLLNIINDILDFSRIESGNMILDEVPFDLREEVRYCINLAGTYTGKNKVTLVSDIDDKVPGSIIGDPFRIRQIISNLLLHSVKNTPGGEIRLNCSLKGRKDGILTIGFELLDTGLSFDEPALKRMFGNVASLESKAVKNNDDSVFGTILARQLVELMGGNLEARSPSGLPGDGGTKVTFTISAYSNERMVKKIPLEKITSFEKIRTLVITGKGSRDEDMLSKLHQTGLTLNVTSFTRASVSQIKNNLSFPDERYSLIIIFDDNEFDGFEAAHSLFENKLAGSFILMMISAVDKKGNHLKCLTMGIDHYLVKPLAEADLGDAIKRSFPYAGKIPVAGVSVRENLRILVVEDNKLNQKAVGTMLRSMGYSFDLAEDGYTGYLQAKSKQYDLILMDLLLPEIDGFEATQKILKVDKSVKIVAFTADNMPETKKKAELSGITDFIPKPVRMDDLNRLFSKHFRK